MRHFTAVLLFPLLGVLSGCNSPPQSVQETPKLLSNTTRAGKGVPNGRSDSSMPYLRGVVLAASNDPSYGRSTSNPVHTGPQQHRGHVYFLNALRGPNGEPVEYERIGSCCAFEDKSLPLGGGLLDVYRIKVDGQASASLLYVDMYRKGQLRLPQGFTQRSSGSAI